MSSTPAQSLAAALRAAALRSGIDLDARGGSRIRLAEEAGTSPTTITRLLAGDRLPEARTITLLARAVKADPIEFLLVANILDEEDLPGGKHSPEQALAELGVKSPANQALILGIVEQMNAHQRELDEARQASIRVAEAAHMLAQENIHTGAIPDVVSDLHRIAEDLHPDIA